MVKSWAKVGQKFVHLCVKSQIKSCGTENLCSWKCLSFLLVFGIFFTKWLDFPVKSGAKDSGREIPGRGILSTP